MSGQIILSHISRMRFTGARIAQYETIKIVRQSLGRKGYSDALKEIERAEKKARQQALRREKEREARELAALQAELAAEAKKEKEQEARREAARIARNAKKRANRAAAKEAAADAALAAALAAETSPGFIRRIEIHRDTNMTATNQMGLTPNPIWEELAELLRIGYTGSTVRMMLIANGEVVSEDTKNIIFNSSWENVYWRYISPFLNPYEDNTVKDILQKADDEEIPMEYVAFVLTTNQQVPAARLAQRFRDGVVHCVIDPLVALWKKMGENSEADSSKKRCFQIMKKIEALRPRFPDGVPECDMEEVAKVAQRKLVVKDLFGNAFSEYNVKSTKTFSWTNTRENHVDVGHLALQGAAEKVSQEAFDQIHDQHMTAWNENKEVFLMEGGADGVRCIRSATGAWRVRDPLFDAFEEVQNRLGFKEYGLDCVKYSELNEYIKEACVVNSAPVVLSEEEATGHRDLKAAYTQHTMTSYFQGFLGKIQQSRRLNVSSSEARAFLVKHLGIFRVRILSNENPLLVKLGLAETVTLPSPEIIYFIDHGVKVEIVSGVFGSSWTATKEEMYDGLMDPIGDVGKPYAQFAGCLGHQSDKKTYRFFGGKDWASHLKACGYETYFNDGIISVKILKDFYYSHIHIMAFITSYTRINMLEAMEKFEVDNLVAVVLDGIYYRGECPEISDQFRIKKVKPLMSQGVGWYTPSYATDEFMPVLEDVKLLSSCILSGQGGCGKTYSVLTDNAFVDVLYVVPQHTLGIENAKKHSVRYTTIHKLIGVESKNDEGKIIKCRPWKDEKAMPSVCLLDEMTMIDAEWIEKALVMYPETLFFIAGDAIRHNGKMIAFQTRSGKPGEFNRIFDGGLPIKQFDIDRRSLDNDLKQLKIILRAMMLEIYTDGEVDDARVLEGWIRANFPVVPVSQIQFTAGDTVIAGTHKTNEKLLERGIVSGYLSRRKERSHLFVEGWKKRGSFTTHSYQGSTIRDGKVFVVVNDAFELAMIYTAVSRAVRMEQIVFTLV